jgi:hypothetical protein
MKFSALFTLLLILSHFAMYGQDSMYLKLNAIKINKQDRLPTAIYDSISTFRLIMLGEMHGTNEPSEFVIKLAKLMLKKGNKIQIGLEIPSEEIKNFKEDTNDSNICSSPFFNSRRLDARASSAWANLILEFKNSQDVELFYYDVNTDDVIKQFNRDSIMYTKIKKRIQMHPAWKTITLGGNIHNMLLPYDSETTMGLYLYNDKDLNLSKSILSLAHYYAYGTIWENSGNALSPHQVDNSNSFFAKGVDYENYLFLYPQFKYNGIYFTRKVTASNLYGIHH